MPQNGWFRLDETGRASQQTQGAPAPKITRLSAQETIPVVPPKERIVPVGQTAPQPSPPAVQSRRQNGLFSQTAGVQGPVLLQDNILHETLDDFVTEKIPERAVHVKGWGAKGYFEPYDSMKEHTMLCFLQNPGERVEVSARFSLAVSNKGTPDTSRNVRGFSTKFYTKEGNFDLLTNHIPVFLVRDAMQFPASIRSLLPSPQSNLSNSNRFWEFFANTPEATHFVLWLFSDIGTPKDLRHLRTYGVNTYVWENEKGERKWVKYHWLPLLGEEYLTAQQAAQIACQNPDSAGQDLFDAISRREYPQYELCVQLMDPQDAQKLAFDPLDDTKVWSFEDYPLIKVGRLTLTQTPENYMEQVEKLAFSPANLLKGAQFSLDKMLQGRSSVYFDAQRARLGHNFRQIPVNQGKVVWTPQGQVSSLNGTAVQGEIGRYDSQKPDDFTQAGQFYSSLEDAQKARLAQNIASQLVLAGADVRQTALGYFQKASGQLYTQLIKAMEECRRTL